VSDAPDPLFEVLPRTLTAPPDITIAAYGTPATKGSREYKGHRPGKGGRMVPILVDSSDKTLAPWTKAVAQATRDAMTNVQGSPERADSTGVPGLVEITPRPPLDGPLSVEAIFTIPRPPSVKGFAWPATRSSGDVDKLLRAVFDALTKGKAIAGDSRIVETATRKVYPGMVADALDKPGVLIRVWRLA
jgi:hypothetical protein